MDRGEIAVAARVSADGSGRERAFYEQPRDIMHVVICSFVCWHLPI